MSSPSTLETPSLLLVTSPQNASHSSPPPDNSEGNNNSHDNNNNDSHNNNQQTQTPAAQPSLPQQEDDAIPLIPTLNLAVFCTETDGIRDFLPLGGNKQDCAIVACAAFHLGSDASAAAPGDSSSVSVLPPLPGDVLDSSLAILCAPQVIAQPADVIFFFNSRDKRKNGKETKEDVKARYCLPFACRLRTTDQRTQNELRESLLQYSRVRITVELPPAITELPDDFLAGMQRLAVVDLRPSAHIERLGHHFMLNCTDTPPLLRTRRQPRSDDADDRAAVLPPSPTNDNDTLPAPPFTPQQQNPETSPHSPCSFTASPLPLGRDDDEATDVVCNASDTAQDVTSTSRLAVLLPHSLVEIGDGCLLSCEGLDMVDLRHCTRLRRIGSRFLYRNMELVSVLFPGSSPFSSPPQPHQSPSSSLTEVGGYMMSECRSLQEVDLRSCTSLETIGEGFCFRCDNLQQVHLPGASLSTTMTEAEAPPPPPALSSVVASSSSPPPPPRVPQLQTISHRFLSSCAMLERVDLRSCCRLRSLGEWFCYRSNKLTYLALPDSIQVVGNGFLLGCGKVEIDTTSSPNTPEIVKRYARRSV